MSNILLPWSSGPLPITICCGERKWPYFWLTKWPKHSILVNIYTWGAPVVGIDHCTQATKYAEYRSAISWHIWEHSVENPASPALNCWEYDRFKGFKGFIGLQWLQRLQRGSKASRGSKRFKDLQRSRQRSRRPVRERESSEDQQRTKIGEIERGVAEMQHLFAWCCRCATVWCNVILYSVSGRHSVTQHLVAKKTNNFNGLTQKNRLTAVRHH